MIIMKDEIITIYYIKIYELRNLQEYMKSYILVNFLIHKFHQVLRSKYNIITILLRIMYSEYANSHT